MRITNNFSAETIQPRRAWLDVFQSQKDQDYQPSLMHLTIHLSQLKVREKVLMIEAGKGIYDHHATLQRILEGIPTEEKDNSRD